VAALPAWLRVALAQPLFILGAIFVLFVIFVPGGIAAIPARVRIACARRAGHVDAARGPA
jgi:branched-chain amino acid transport system permease protein